MLAAFRFPIAGPRQASAFDWIMRPQCVAVPILGVAGHGDPGGQTWPARRAGSHCIGPAGPVLFRATEAEQVLTSAPAVDAAVIGQAVAAAEGQAAAHQQTPGHRAYRHEMVAVLLQRVLGRARERQRAGV